MNGALALEGKSFQSHPSLYLIPYSPKIRALSQPPPGNIAAELPGLPQHQRRTASIQAEALNNSANALLSGRVDPGNRPLG